MVNVFNEIIMSGASAEDQLINWKHDTIFNSLKTFKAIIHKNNQLRRRIENCLKSL